MLYSRQRNFARYDCLNRCASIEIACQRRREDFRTVKNRLASCNPGRQCTRRRKFAIMVFPATGDRHRCGSGKDLTEAGDYLKNSG
jgi:hypothetical protein